MFRMLWMWRKDADIWKAALRAYLAPIKHSRPLKGRGGYATMWFSIILSYTCLVVSAIDIAFKQWGSASLMLFLTLWNALCFMDMWLLLMAQLIADVEYARTKGCGDVNGSEDSPVV